MSRARTSRPRQAVSAEPDDAGMALRSRREFRAEENVAEKVVLRRSALLDLRVPDLVA
jgi:hypothetical protein